MRRTLLVITAVLLATIGTTLLYVYVSTADNRAKQGVQTVEVLVAKGDWPAGTPVASLRTQIVQLPRFGAVPYAISDLGAVQGKVLAIKVIDGQQLSSRMFGAAATGGLTPGHRAVSVQIGEAERVASLIKAGSQVDVFRLEQSSAVPVLDDAHVLSADDKGIVTFDLTETDAKTLLDAVARGRLVLRIRG
jgi:pilus assembly protein CpaB